MIPIAVKAPTNPVKATAANLITTSFPLSKSAKNFNGGNTKLKAVVNVSPIAVPNYLIPSNNSLSLNKSLNTLLN